MDIFIEKEFIYCFEENYPSNSDKVAWKILYSIFTEYTRLNWFLNSSEEDFDSVLLSSKVLMLLANNNSKNNISNDFYKTLTTTQRPIQTLVFTKDKKEWFNRINDKSIYCFCISNFEKNINEILIKHDKEFDLSDKENKFEWNYFSFISDKTNFIFITDPYIFSILKDEKEEERIERIKENLISLFKKNLNKSYHYKIFIISIFGGTTEIFQINNLLKNELSGFNVSFFLIPRNKSFKKFEFHDRLIYTNYSITKSGKGFNLQNINLINSEVITSTIFSKKTYKKYLNHFDNIKEYIFNLKTQYNNRFNNNTYNELNKFIEW